MQADYHTADQPKSSADCLCPDPASQCGISSHPAVQIVFGPFCLYPGQRLLLEHGQPVAIGSRALDILIAVIDRPGEVILKNALMARVWPDTVVGADNLRAQVAALRRALRDGAPGRRYIATVPGRGYCFVGTVGAGHSADRR